MKKQLPFTPISRRRFPLILPFIIISVFFGCSTGKVLTQNITPGITELKDSKYLEAEFTFSLDSISVDDPAPVMKIWVSNLMSLNNQKILEHSFDGVKPDITFSDFENGNAISSWDFSERLNTTSSFTIKRKIRAILSDYQPVLNPDITMRDYDTVESNLYYFYTKSEPSLEQTPEIIRIAHEASGNNSSLKEIIKAVFDWVYGKMKYVYPPEERGVLGAIKTYSGDCGQYSALYITLCRSLGIPARQQSGFAIQKGGFGYHVWSEIYFPGKGWIPVDASNADGFGRIKNTQLVASTGMNIPLPGVPSWATYEDQDAQGNRTDFMQFMTTVKKGVKVKVTSARKLIKFEDYK